ncbi:carotenoid biosynthesis protein [Aridibaculum aurantiacum]|uniref:carotenoid biosynthesis protein n=1 Tax=Aridibaculum aurantiacum TaxID=2810307 RepID=UPI001A958477|nr:carotenoid biosynthesis protein [Aridibaculum aurantiacum]
MSFNIPSFNKAGIATFIALLFHVSGCIGMFTIHREWFIENTTLNLLLMFGLIIWTHGQLNMRFLLFMVLCFVVGMTTEMIGVHTGFLFGQYAYGTVMGPKLLDVPYLIGINWFVVMYCSGMAVTKLHEWIEQKYVTAGSMLSDNIKKLSIIIDGALLATLFDYVMEPVAVKLGFWTWLGDGSIPFLNYLCWFIISTGLLYVFTRSGFQRHNQFAVHLLIIQLLFFGTLRTFL